MAVSRLASKGHWPHFLTCIFLYARNLFSRAELEVESITMDEPTLLSPSFANISINAVGCHRIEILGVGRFPGNATKIDIPFDGRSTSFEVCLYGRNSLFRKMVPHNVISLDLVQNEPPVAFLPKVIGMQYEGQLYASFNEPIQSKFFERGAMLDIPTPSIGFAQPDLEPYKAEALLTLKPNEQRILQHS